MEKFFASNEFLIKAFQNVSAKINGKEISGDLVFTNGFLFHYSANSDSISFKFGPTDLENEALSKKPSKDQPLTSKSQSMLRIFNNQTKRNIILIFSGTTCNSDIDQVIEQYKVLKSSPPLPEDNVIEKLKEVIPEELLINENNELDAKYAKDLLKNNPVLDNLLRTYPDLLQDDYLINFQHQIIAGLPSGRLLPKNSEAAPKKEFAIAKDNFKTGSLSLDNHLVSQIFRKHPVIYEIYKNTVPSIKSEEEFFKKDFISLLREAKQNAIKKPIKPASLESDIPHGQGIIEKSEISGEELKSLQTYADAISIGNKFNSAENYISDKPKQEEKEEQIQKEEEPVTQIPPQYFYNLTEEEIQDYNNALLEMNISLMSASDKIDLDPQLVRKALQDMTPDDGMFHVFTPDEDEEILKAATRKAELQIFSHAFWQAVNHGDADKCKKLGEAIEKLSKVVSQEAETSKLPFLYRDLDAMFTPIINFIHN